jgi:hypothetical protein
MTPGGTRPDNSSVNYSERRRSGASLPMVIVFAGYQALLVRLQTIGLRSQRRTDGPREPAPKSEILAIAVAPVKPRPTAATLWRRSHLCSTELDAYHGITPERLKADAGHPGRCPRRRIDPIACGGSPLGACSAGASELAQPALAKAARRRLTSPFGRGRETIPAVAREPERARSRETIRCGPAGRARVVQRRGLCVMQRRARVMQRRAVPSRTCAGGRPVNPLDAGVLARAISLPRAAL